MLHIKTEGYFELSMFQKKLLKFSRFLFQSQSLVADQWTEESEKADRPLLSQIKAVSGPGGHRGRLMVVHIILPFLRKPR